METSAPNQVKTERRKWSFEILSSTVFLARQETQTDPDQVDPKRSQVVQIVREAKEARGGVK